MAFAAYLDAVQKIYIAFYQRPADPAGLRYWAQRMDAAGGDQAAVIDAFASSAEATALYGAINKDTIGAVVDKIYMALFNRAPDEAGKKFYVDGFNAGKFTAGSITLSVLGGAQGDDAVAVSNKLTVANEFTKQVDGRDFSSPDFGTGSIFKATYAGDADAVSARDILKAVTSSPATVLNSSQVVEAIKTKIADAGDAILKDAGANSFTLTTGSDVATAATFDAPTLVSVSGVAVQTLGSDDKLTGTTATTDVLNATLNSAINVKPVISGVEIINLSTTAASNLDMAAATGVKSIKHSASVAGADLTVLGIGAIVDVAVENGNPAGTTDTLFQFGSSVLTGTADTVKVALMSNGTSTAASGHINVAGLGTGSAETLDVTVTGTNRISSLSSDVGVGLGVATSATNGATTYKFSGDGSIRIGTQLTNATTIDGSGLTTGGMRVVADAGKDVKVTGGKGADNVDFAAGLTNADKYDGGDGRDVLVHGSTTNVGLASGHGISNVEILQVGGSALGGVAASFTVDSDVTTSFDAFVHNSTGAMTYTNTVGANMADATKGLTIVNTGAVTMNIKGAGGLGANADALNVVIGSSSGTATTALQTAAGVATGNLTFNSIETVTLDVKADAALQTSTGTGTITASTIGTLNIKGGAVGEAFAVGTITNAGGTLTKIDASTFAGNLTVAGTAVAQTITSGSGNDVLSTGGHAAFADTVSSDVLAGGAGNDQFVFATSDTAYTTANLVTLAASTADGYSELTTISDLNLGGGTAGTAVDLLDFSAVGGANAAGTLGLNANTVQVVNGGAAVALTGATFGAAVNALFLTGGVLDTDAAASVLAGLFTWGGETFLIAGNDATANDGFAAGVAGSDIIIRVTGVTGTLDGSDFATF